MDNLRSQYNIKQLSYLDKVRVIVCDIVKQIHPDDMCVVKSVELGLDKLKYLEMDLDDILLRTRVREI